jgi:hypothetical protein
VAASAGACACVIAAYLVHDPDPAGEVLHRVQEPPITPPVLEIQGTEVTALTSTWYDTTTKAFDHTDSGNLTAPDLPSFDLTDRLQFSVLAAQVPAMINVRPFHAIDADGIPTAPSTTVECATVRSPCDVVQRPDQLEVDVPLDSATVFVTIDVLYEVPELGLQQLFNVVAYGLNVSQR